VVAAEEREKGVAVEKHVGVEEEENYET